eukprot:m.28703 g.28703  ORF g.28703 m.28703 type:complete len:417 (-) comp8026_c0_seq2:87-1337(-)
MSQMTVSKPQAFAIVGVIFLTTQIVWHMAGPSSTNNPDESSNIAPRAISEHKCPPPQKVVCPGCSQKCQEDLWKPGPLVNPVFIKQRNFHKKTQNEGITLAVHVSADRVKVLTQLCNNWKQEISAAIFVYDKDDEVVARWCDEDIVCNCRSTQGRIKISLVHSDELAKRSKSLYPVNTLRNEALSNVDTKYVLLIDADFVIGGDMDAIPLPPSGSLYVLPCYRLTDLKENEAPPLQKDLLLEWKSRGRVIAYGEDPDWPFGHMDVDYSTWYKATNMYEIEAPNIYFEPYFVAHTNEITLFDERYRGYGAGDKALQFHLLFKAGLQAFVLPTYFLLHIPHPKGDWHKPAAVQELYNGFHGLDRMSYGVHSIDFWTRVMNNCVLGKPCNKRRPVCSTIPNPATGGQTKCNTNPDRYRR